mmetsp:Transcript_122321/g.346824  ORF Transcript_122321/g.346824 Transcript_122321/m.346824 type:complete len:227 (+) Transcript_122321:85-765(+)
MGVLIATHWRIPPAAQRQHTPLPVATPRPQHPPPPASRRYHSEFSASTSILALTSPRRFFLKRGACFTDFGFFFSSSARSFISLSLACSFPITFPCPAALTLISLRPFIGRTLSRVCSFSRCCCNSSSYAWSCWCDGFSKLGPPLPESARAVARWCSWLLRMKASAERLSLTSRNHPFRLRSCLVAVSRSSRVSFAALTEGGWVLLARSTWFISAAVASGGSSSWG